MRPDLPEHCCCIITDPRGRLLLELRPADARKAPGLMTCYGGKREPGESPESCLRRELAEELGWVPAEPIFACDLVKGDRFIARFYQTAWNGYPLSGEPGRIAVWAPRPALPGLPVAPWHRMVLMAVAEGRARAEAPP